VFRLHKIYTFCLIIAFLLPIYGYSQDSLIVPLEKFVDEQMAGFQGISSESLLSYLLENPQLLNKILQHKMFEKNRFLKDLNLEFKTFKANGNDSLLGLGLAYSYQRDIATTTVENRVASQTGLSLSLQSQGNIAFDRNTNPADFLDGDFSFHLYRSWGGAVMTSDSLRDKLNDMEFKLAQITDSEALRTSPLAKEVTRIFQEYMTSQFYLDFALRGGLETNQNFTQKQYVFGGKLGIDFKPWGSGYLNFFDWPFAAVRFLAGYDQELQPRGSSFPTLFFGVDQVVPSGTDYRTVIGDSSNFLRMRGEIAFRTPINRSSRFEANLRFYKEISPEEVIKQIGQDQHLYFAAVITTGSGLFISYTNGKLPFDLRESQVYSLGFEYNF